MKKIKIFISCLLFSAAMTACNAGSGNDVESTISAAASETAEAVSETEITAETEPIIEERKSDRVVCEWLYNNITDSEEFTDLDNYRYYARTLGLEKDYFLDPAVWEVYYNEEININNEIDGKEIYLLRINPYVLLDIYAKNNNCTVNTVCSQLSATKEQLYYNWGYSTTWKNYDEEHADLKVFASDKEIDIFGISNSEDRIAVMRTHTLTVDTQDNYICTYSSNPGNRLKIKRMDMLGAVSEESKLYSEYTEQEKAASFTVNGIGIRAVIPLTIPNAWQKAEGNDTEVTPFINVSPYAYGCTDNDKIEIKNYSVTKEEEK